MNHSLEKGSRKFHCPSCGRKTFVRYVNNSTGEHLHPEVGHCDRLDNCGFHCPPREFFATERAHTGSQSREVRTFTPRSKNAPQSLYRAPNYIEQQYLLKSLRNYDQNAFVQFLLSICPDETDRLAVWKAVQRYQIGTTSSGETVFWYIDKARRICKGKILRYDQETGKRSCIKHWFENGERCEQRGDSIESRLKKKGLINQDFETDKQVFFGEHLISGNDAPIAIVEAEKTAIVASICESAFPVDFIWLGAGSCSNLKAEKLTKFRGRKIILYPDANRTAFEQWKSEAHQARLQGLDVTLSTLIEKRATEEQKADGYDLADYLIAEQLKLVEYNKAVDLENERRDRLRACLLYTSPSPRD